MKQFARITRILSITAALVLLPLSTALAGEARASGGGAMNTGPGLDFPQVGSLTNGNFYEVKECLADISWCQVVGDGGTLGWVPAGNIVGSGAKLHARQWGLYEADFPNPWR